jgi:O-antigen ligase
MQQISNKTQARVALACGVLAILTAVWIYWLVLPGVILGLAAVVLGWRARRKEGSEVGSVALALGIVAILLVPSVIVIANDAEDWGRDCALDPTSDPNC